MLVVTSCKVKTKIKEDMEKKFPNVSFQWKESIQEAEPVLKEADVLITYGEDLLAEHLEPADNLKWIMVISAGLDEMPFEKIDEKGIQVTNARGIHAIPMSEYAISMILQESRKAKDLHELEKAHSWDKRVKMEEITGKTMLVVGTGAIGQEVARLAKAFRMKTIGVSHSGRSKDHFDECAKNDRLHDYLKEADFVVAVLPHTNDTDEFFGKEEFSAMKKDAIFLNMGRGKTVDQGTMIQALKDQQLGHAVLDVVEEEPLDSASPLWDLENCTITPHLSGISRLYQERAFEIFEENLKDFEADKPLSVNVIDPKRGY
ncbi:D-2-hydroxyacid dehydrogenase [Halalkalibacillus sediminis]|uniref:D-2-hydroxyacid dehydrogenase n=1 Tax=Halalkalibacillus sediminis TaxID=2018042 RepID=A0A2I0QRL4_9BACI|nr:D-2-hydroxyacid dehydrogenase [Halalkalibacillus sediminis]PKR76971.1 D-2-hydroxyacid dehydrogenase [Halalkalibacillus sediminis]